MTAIDFLDLLTAKAKRYRKGASDSVIRNRHMNTYSADVRIPQATIDALLVDFINSIGVGMGVDYGLYTTDIQDNKL